MESVSTRLLKFPIYNANDAIGKCVWKWTISYIKKYDNEKF